MLSTKRFKLLSLIVALAILAMAATAEEPAKKRRTKLFTGPDNPYLVFVPGQPMLVAVERGRAALLLRYPELEVVRKLEGVSEQKLDTIKSSPDGTWLVGFFDDRILKTGGTLRVWNTTTGESYLFLDDASRAFQFHPTESRLVVWQPKGGITQWTLGEGESKRVGPAITLHHVWGESMRISNDGRYLLIEGGCGGKEYWEFCVYDLKDGSTVSGTRRENKMGTSGHWLAIPIENYKEFSEILASTQLDQPVEHSNCKRVGEHRALCRDRASVALVELDSVQPQSALSVRLFPGRYIWEFRAGTEPANARDLNSCALSADGRWLAVGANGKDVLLFDTEQLESTSNWLAGTWKQPTLVKRFEMP